jgi:hypothetical protein
MTVSTYQITAWCDRTFISSFDVQANTPEQALEIARQQVDDEPAEEGDMGYPWDTFRVCDSGNNELLTCRQPRGAFDHSPGEPERLRPSTSKLLDALKIAEGFVQWAMEHGADPTATANALTFIRSAIAGEEGDCCIAPAQPVRFLFTHEPEENPDRAYVLVDGKFDVAIIRTDEGIVVDVYPAHGFETIATTYAFDSDAEEQASESHIINQPRKDSHK